MLRDEENMSDTLLHRYRNQIALVLFLNHLLEPTDMHCVKDALND